MTSRLERLMPLLLWLDGMLQRIVPPKADRVAWVSDPDYIGNAFHLFRHTVTSRPDLDHVWLIEDPAARTRIDADMESLAEAVAPGSRVRVVRRHSVRGYWLRLRSRRIFHTHGVYPMSSAHRRDVVSLWHGMPIKCIGALNTVTPDPHPTFGTVHLATSQFFRGVIAAAFRAVPDDVVVCSLPRCDVLTRPHPAARSVPEIRRVLGVPEDRRLVVWLPTYRTPGNRRTSRPGKVGFHTFLDDIDDADWARVVDRADASGCTVVIKLHPTDPLNDVGHEIGADHVRLVRSQEWLATGIELYDLLAASDALVSDISSVLIDYLVTDRPLGLIGFDDEAYNRDVVFPVDRLRNSSRIHDLVDPDQLDDFFARVGRRQPCTPDEDDLSPWLYDVPAGVGCESVLAAVGL